MREKVFLASVKCSLSAALLSLSSLMVHRFWCFIFFVLFGSLFVVFGGFFLGFFFFGSDVGH